MRKNKKYLNKDKLLPSKIKRGITMARDNTSFSCKGHKQIIKRLRNEINTLKETCEVLADEKLLEDINHSLKQIREGRYIPLSKL